MRSLTRRVLLAAAGPASTIAAAATAAATAAPPIDPPILTVTLSTVTIDARTGDRVHRGRTTYGQTVRGTPLIAYRYSHVDDRHPVGRRVFALGCIHGNEQAGISILDDLWQSPIPPPLGVEYVFVFHPNPDGERADTRQNARLVDLNRNFPVDWRHRGVRGDLTYSGPAALSEPETRDLVPLVHALTPTIILSYHQPLDYLGSIGGDQRYARRFAGAVRQRYLSSNAPDGTGQIYTGTMSEWINKRYPDTLMMTLELPREVTATMHRAHRQAITSLARRYPRPA